MVLKPVGNGAGVGSGIDLKMVGDSVVIQNRMQLDGIEAQAVLIAHVHRNSAVLFEVSDVLINEGKRCIRCELCEHLWLWNTVFRWQVEVQRRILRVRCPCRGRSILSRTESR